MNVQAVIQGRILVVDDEPQNVRLLEKRLRAAGHQVLTAPDGHSAVNLAQQHLPDLILLDLMMPDIDGLGVLAQLQEAEETAQIPVIFVSASNDTDQRIRALGLGGHDYITKPFHPEELLARVRAALRMKARHDDLRRRQAALGEIARRDPLTQLYNRRYLDEALARALAECAAAGSALSVQMIDLDHFKTINDTFGHLSGDAVLQELAALLTAHVRLCDILGRYGGDELLLVLPHTGLPDAFGLAERLLQTTAAHPFAACPGHQVTLSIGVAATGDGVSDLPDLIELADRRLYDAKRLGRNQALAGAADEGGRV